METLESSSEQTFSENLLSFMQGDIPRISCNNTLEMETVLGAFDAKILAADTFQSNKKERIITRRTNQEHILVDEKKNKDGETSYYIYRTDLEDDN